MNVGIIICTHLDSKRLERKPLINILGKPVIEHLISRLKLKTILSMPPEDAEPYTDIVMKYSHVYIHPVTFYKNNPMLRMLQSANEFNLDTIVRITHDKIFVDQMMLDKALASHIATEADYTALKGKLSGCGFEIFSKKLLEKTCDSVNKPVEHLSYYLKHYANKINYFPIENDIDARLLIDYKEDVTFINTIMTILGSKCTLDDVIEYIRKHPMLRSINKLPHITFYTCAYNAESTIEKCMKSVLDLMSQIKFTSEYIIIDDFSNDSTYEKIVLNGYQVNNDKIQWHRNEKNIGLAASSNLALEKAKGKYLIRVDADDFLIQDECEWFIEYAINNSVDACYPANFHGSFDKIQDPKLNHHVGGAIFKREAINTFKFNEILRGYEGLDFFYRAKDKLNITYYNTPTFFYTQSDNSMSKTDLEYRNQIKTKIENNEL